ncbi:calcium-translocating P-type ATPase, SERCA-type [Shimazuella sp. AN120528]|uniref:calcium-translocating P-type ATPase, SERCA-type n=1 Tax=Shimazuella soli TaxID=1892854 RepID=UPI001F101C30|nr:calcium-translocating P-type ATPase, SERCA-type [Shimazuella soli]MCH5584789.1 calcium-translocating P-type ATPase, SERCA-type [Shimazuella soli]
MTDSSRFVGWTAQQVTDYFGVKKSAGLSEKEAKSRLAKVGNNQLSEGEKVSLFAVFFSQFQDFMVLILLVATLISGLLGEYVDAIAILSIIVLNSILGFVQEVKAERSLSALKKLSAPMAKVYRDGGWKRIDASLLVPGDVVSLVTGDRIPADIRWVETTGLMVEESALTGESLPIEKIVEPLTQADLTLADFRNMSFMGTMVVKGSGLGVIVNTGMKTEMGRIAHLIQSTEQNITPLQRRLEQLGKILIIVALFLTALVVVTGVMHGQDLYKMFLAGVSLAVAAIPEGLPAIVTIALALGVQRMIKRKAIVRKLPSVETLGCASIICSDKTGTLTENKMTVTHVYTNQQLLTLEKDELVQQNPTLQQLLQIAVLCNNATLVQKGKKVSYEGDPTEGALMVMGAHGGVTREVLDNSWAKIKEHPFDSERKMMSVVVENKQKQKKLLVKGAPDVLIRDCTHILQNGRVEPITAKVRQQLLAKNEELASNALRNLAFAYREVSGSVHTQSESQLERNLIFVGLAGMIDPPRKEVREAIRLCRKAGIRTVMITGDHQATAEAIAVQLGIKRPNGLTVTGRDIYNMKDNEFEQQVENIDVYARVSPEHKLKIVSALQQKGHVVAMTGDGVNDAPAIKAADIGISMGKSGTDVSKEASSLILANDNFATIVSAIEEGRHIYDNIQKFISYLLASNVGEILVMFFAMLMGLPLPLIPIQILWVNLVTDGLPAMALGVDPAEEDSMSRSPRDSKESIFARRVGWKIVTRGLLIGLCSLLAFWVTYQEAGQLELAQTVAFATLVFSQLIYVFDCRSTGTIFERNPFSNLALCFAVLISVLLLVVVIYYPAFQPIFHTVPLQLHEWVLITVTSTLPVILAGLMDQLRKPIRKTVVQ